MLGLATIAALIWVAEPSATRQAADVNPRLAISGSAMIGPHAIGNQECRPEAARCETRGSFFGVGTSVEARLRIASVFSLHLRPWVVGNAAPDKVFTGAVGGGLGLGAYGRRVFGRVEYIALHAFGDADFVPPFFEGEVATATWGHSAGMVSAGFRKEIADRLRIELWGGPMFGPWSRRSLPDGEVDRRTLVTFMVGFGLSFDALPGPW